MSISDAINNVKQKISNVYNALEAKGATMPGTMNLDHMVTTVEAIPEFEQTISLYNGWSGFVTNNGFVLSGGGPQGSSITIPSGVNGVYLGPNLYRNSNSLESIDLQKIPFENNDMSNAFNNCTNLTTVLNINENVTIMNSTFYKCSNFNQSVQIPNSVTDMCNTFRECHVFNQSIQIPDSVVNMVSTFEKCTKLNADIYIGNSVVNMASAFEWCPGFGKNIVINSPSVTSISFTFETLGHANVFIPFKYANAVNTVTFSTFVSAGYLYANGAQNNSTVKVYDKGY